jgi:hypothetical protein
MRGKACLFCGWFVGGRRMASVPTWCGLGAVCGRFGAGGSARSLRVDCP